MEKIRNTAVMERPEAKISSQAQPYTGIEALWDRVDGFRASLVIAGGIATIAFILSLMVHFIFS